MTRARNDFGGAFKVPFNMRVVFKCSYKSVPPLQGSEGELSTLVSESQQQLRPKPASFSILLEQHSGTKCNFGANQRSQPGL